MDLINSPSALVRLRWKMEESLCILSRCIVSNRHRERPFIMGRIEIMLLNFLRDICEWYIV